MSRFVIITWAADFERRVREAVAGSLHGTVHALSGSALNSGPQEILRQETGEPPEVMILGPDIPTDEALKLATLIDLQYPQISVVLAADAESDLVLTAMRAGVRDIVSPNADAETIRILLERVCLAATSRRSGLPLQGDSGHEAGRVIAVMSTKGGVGKTTVATNLAVGLAKVAPMSVVIVDLDLQFGDVASGLLLDPEHTTIDAVTGPASQDVMILKAFLTVHPGGFYALCAPIKPNEADLVSADHVRGLLARLAAEFRYVIVDTAPGLDEYALAALERATDVVWVVGMDIPSVRGLRTGLGLLKELGLVPQGRHVVLNFASRRAGLTVEDIEATLGVPVDVVIPHSVTLPLSTNKGIPVLQEGLRDSAAKGLRKLVERFDPDWGEKVHWKMHRRAVAP